jgi:hypothetical protein
VDREPTEQEIQATLAWFRAHDWHLREEKLLIDGKEQRIYRFCRKSEEEQ